MIQVSRIRFLVCHEAIYSSQDHAECLPLTSGTGRSRQNKPAHFRFRHNGANFRSEAIGAPGAWESCPNPFADGALSEAQELEIPDKTAFQKNSGTFG